MDPSGDPELAKEFINLMSREIKELRAQLARQVSD